MKLYKYFCTFYLLVYYLLADNQISFLRAGSEFPLASSGLDKEMVVQTVVTCTQPEDSHLF